MPQQRIKVQFPFGGISDAIAKSTQPNLTTRDAQNCRGKDPQTGRIRGAQRAGLASFTSGQDQPYDEDDVAVSTPVQALAGVSFDQPRIDYTRLQSNRLTSIGHDQPQHIREAEVWHRSVVGDGSAFSPVVDIQGNIYIITDGRTIHKYNPDGTLISSLTIPATSTASVVRSLAVDSLGNIYAVAAAGHNAIGGQLMRWEPHEDLEYTLRYNITLNARPTHFKLRFNTLWLVTEGSYGDPSQSRLEAWGFLDSESPLKLWARYIPHPCYGLDLGEAGHIFIASGANPDRMPSAGATGVVPGVVGWLPNELYRGSGRIHSWLDAYYLPNISTGTTISEWTDARGFVPSEVPNFLPIYDTQPRSAVNPFPTPSTTAGHHSPTYLANGFIDKPSVRFDRTETHNFGGGVGETEVGQGLYFKANGSRLNRTEIRIDADTGPYSRPWEEQTALVPGARVVVWTMFLVVRLGDQSRPGCLLNMYGTADGTAGKMDIQILVNADATTGGGPGPNGGYQIGKNAGKIMLRGGVSPHSEGRCIRADSEAYPHNLPPGVTLGGSVNGDTQTAIITIHCKGTEVPGSAFRVNGEVIDTFAMYHSGYIDSAAHNDAAPSNFVRGAYLGVPFKNYSAGAHPGDEEDALNDTFFSAGGLTPFDGDICEILVVNGHTIANLQTNTGYNDPTYDNLPGGASVDHSANYSEGNAPAHAAYINAQWTPPSAYIVDDSDDSGNMVTGNGGNYREHYRANATSSGLTTEVELIEGYLAHKWGISSTLAVGHPYRGNNLPGDFGATTGTLHAYAPIQAFDDWGAFMSDEDAALTDPAPITAKYDPSNGDVVWATAGAGMGNGVVVDNKGGVYTCGWYYEDPDTGVIDYNRLRKLIDLGSEVSLEDYGGQIAWAVWGWNGGHFDYPYADLKLSHDLSTLFVPVNRFASVADNGAPDGLHGGYGRLMAYHTEDGSSQFQLPMVSNHFIPNPDPVSGVGPDSWTWARDISKWGNTAPSDEDDQPVEEGVGGDYRLRIERNAAANPQGGEVDAHLLSEIAAQAQSWGWVLVSINPGTTTDTTRTSSGVPRWKNLLFPFDQDAAGARAETPQAPSSGGFAGGGPSQEMLNQALDFEQVTNSLGGWSYANTEGQDIERRTPLMRSPAWDYEAARLRQSTNCADLMAYIPKDRIQYYLGTLSPGGKEFIWSCYVKRDPENPDVGSQKIALEIEQWGPNPADPSAEITRNHENGVQFDLSPGLDLDGRTNQYDLPTTGVTDYGIRQIGSADENGEYWYRCWVSLELFIGSLPAGTGTQNDTLKVRMDPCHAQPDGAGGIFAWQPTLEVVGYGVPPSQDEPDRPPDPDAEASDGPTVVAQAGYHTGPPTVGNAALTLGGRAQAIWLGKPNSGDNPTNDDRQVFLPEDAWGAYTKAAVWLQFYVKEQDHEAEPGRPSPGKLTFQAFLNAHNDDSTGHTYINYSMELRQLAFDARKGVDDAARWEEHQGSYTYLSDTAGTGEGDRVTLADYSATDGDGNPLYPNLPAWPYTGSHTAKSLGNGWILCGVRIVAYSPSGPGLSNGYANDADGGGLCNSLTLSLHPGGSFVKTSIAATNGSADSTETTEFMTFFRAEMWGFQLFPNTNLVNNSSPYFPTEDYCDPGRRGVTGIALPPTEPDYTGDDDATNTNLNIKPAGPEFAYMTTFKESGRYGPNIVKQRLVAAEPLFDEGQSSRTTKVVAVAGGDIYTVGHGEPGYEIAIDGRGALDADAGQIMSTAHFGRLYFTDGFNYAIYDPRTNTVSKLEAKTAGEVPQRARLLASYRGRLIFARTPEDPNNYFMSAVGDPEDWDYYPTTPLVTQAINGTLARAGKCPDVINALIPYNDDLLLLGGDHTIFRMTGDPAAGGQLDQVTSSVGIAFGESWTMDPEGVLYFFTPQGCVYGMTPTGQPQRLSNEAIDRRMQDIDLTEFRVKLVWNQEDYGLHVFFMPYTTSSATPYCFFWEKGGNAWWPDAFHADRTPYAVTMIDGEKPDDRKLLFGSRDGYVSRFDRDSTQDVDKKIKSYATLAVAQPQDSELIMPRVTAVHSTMGAGGENAHIYLLAYDEPGDVSLGPDLGSTSPGVRADSDLETGRNPRLAMRGRGPFIDLRIQNNADEEDNTAGFWAVEEIRVDVAASGRPKDLP